jgi:ABC-type transport system involved in multi-copper enzyme maturation permease subunit
LRSRSFLQLLRKEFYELAASRSYWLLLLIVGALVGHAFITATSLYAEASGAGGGPAALSQGLNPLSGVVVPTFGAYDLAATLLFPFVVIRLIAVERETGALMLMLQAPPSFRVVIAAKGVALMIGWLAAFVPGAIALIWWSAMHGHLYAPEVALVVLGHVLRGVVTIGIGAAAGALASSAASAAIVALAVTLGSWALDYAAAARGGVLQIFAAYTPATALRVFEQGELRASTVVVLSLIGACGLAVAGEWLRIGRTLMRRSVGVGAVVAVAAILVVGASQLRASSDISEDQRSSFSPTDEAALKNIREPLVVTAYLAAEDPRLTDLERGVWSKLRRTLPDVRIVYAAKGRSGLFEKPADHYGEVWYALGNKRAMTRSATQEIVLETIYEVAGIPAPTSRDGPTYPGYPLATTPQHVSLVFFVLWPLAVAAAWWWLRRRKTGSRLNSSHA